MKRFLLCAAILCGVSVGRMTAASTTPDPSRLVINEIQVANIDMFIDPSFNYGGWVEFYNPTRYDISLGGLYVSMDAENLTCFQLPADAGVVPSKGFKNIWFDHYDTGNIYSNEAYKQVDFKLEYEGGTIYVSDSLGKLLFSQTYPPAIQRTSYARKTDGKDGEWGITSTPTPEASNVGSEFATTQLAPPVVTPDATVYTDAFYVKVEIPEGATLCYTTNGSTPTLTNGHTNTTGQLRISGGTRTLRFRLFKEGYLPSPVVTRTYVYKDKEYYLPIVSIVTGWSNLYDAKIGAYTVGTNGIPGNGIDNNSNKNRGWERPVNFEYLTKNEDGGSFLMALNQECDFEVSGGWSRNHFAPDASFRLKGNKYYLGQNFLPYPFFEDKPYIKNKAVVVRNGGNDGSARIRDAAVHEIIIKSGFYMDCQAWQPAHIFINGQYKFTYNLREPSNKHHGYSNYGIDTDEIDQFEINHVYGYEQKKGDDKAFRRWMALAQQLADNPTDSLYEEIGKLVDLDEYCNYMAAECYIGCTDWLTNCNNTKGYRSRNDGKFHLITLDLDAAFQSTNMIGSLQGKLADSRYDTGKSFLIEIFLNMLKYEPFKKRFIDAFCIVDGSVFENKQVTDIVTAMKNKMERAMAFEGLSSNLESSANWLINAVKSNRSATMSNMSKYFGLTTGYTVDLSSNIAGRLLLVNGQEVPTGKFNGQLFGPVTLSARVPAGYRFKGWDIQQSGGISKNETLIETNDQWHYYDKGSLDGADWKALNYKQTYWNTGKAPFGYGNVGIQGSQDYATTLDYGGDSQKKYPTYYFRKKFTLDHVPTDEEVYQLTYYVDDGFVAYVNGVEVGRHLIEGTPTYGTYTTTYVAATAATGVITIDNSLLNEGENVIAVEVHNTSASSSDIYWTANLAVAKLLENGIVSTETDFDLSTLNGETMRLVATYEKLPEEELMADLAMPVKVNEVSAGNSVYINDAFKKNDWLELYNTTDVDLDVAGLYVSDDIDNPLKYQIPSSSVMNTLVPAHGHLVLWADKLEAVTQLHVPFKLDNADGKLVFITSSEEFAQHNKAFFNAHPEQKDFADGIVYKVHAGDQSFGRYPDGGNQLYLMKRTTIGKVNSLQSSDVEAGRDEGFMDYGRSTLSLDMAEGWNWVSHPFTHNLSVSRFKEDTKSIVGQTLETVYCSRHDRMEGSLQTLAAGQLYKFQMDEDHTYEMNEQVPTTPAAIALREGWNWIGYPMLGSQTLTAAFNSSDVEAGDIVMGQGGFSVYDTANGWVGTLSTLMSGHGYLYKAAKPKSLRLRPAASRVRLRRVNAAATADGNGIDRHAFPNVMGIIATIQLKDSTDATKLSVWAYADNTCRGRGEWVDGQLFITLYGDGNEELTFKAVDEGGNVMDIQETFAFSSDVLGTRSKPIVLHATGDADAIMAHSQAGKQALPVGYYSLCGTFVGRSPEGLRPGIYVVRYADGTTQKRFIRL